MLLKKQDAKKQLLILMLVSAGLCSFKLKQPNNLFKEHQTEECLDDQTDSAKVIAGKDTVHKAYADEKPASFPGGLNGWRSYLEANLKYPKKAQRKKTEGVVRVQLVVEKDGTVINVKALNDPGDGLAEEAERVIKEGPSWKPAWQNGKHVTYRFVQTITFQLI